MFARKCQCGLLALWGRSFNAEMSVKTKYGRTSPSVKRHRRLFKSLKSMSLAEIKHEYEQFSESDMDEEAGETTQEEVNVTDEDLDPKDLTDALDIIPSEEEESEDGKEIGLKRLESQRAIMSCV